MSHFIFLVSQYIDDIHLKMIPADPDVHHNKHIVKVNCRQGETFKFGIKPNAGSLSFDVETVNGIRFSSILVIDIPLVMMTHMSHSES